MDSLSFKALPKVERLFLEDEKIAFTLKSFFIVFSLFDVEHYVHDSMDGAIRILGIKCVDVCFTFDAHAFLDEEGLGKVKQECEYGSDLMAMKKDLDPDVLLKMYLMLIIFSPEVTFFGGPIFFDESTFSVLNKRCERNSKDEEGLKSKFYFLEG